MHMCSRPLTRVPHRAVRSSVKADCSANRHPPGADGGAENGGLESERHIGMCKRVAFNGVAKVELEAKSLAQDSREPPRGKTLSHEIPKLPSTP